MNMTISLYSKWCCWKLDKFTIIFTTTLFELLSLNLFSYFNNLINFFKGVGLYIIEACIRAVFWNLRKYPDHFILATEYSVVKHFDRVSPSYTPPAPEKHWVSTQMDFVDEVTNFFLPKSVCFLFSWKTVPNLVI